MKRNESKERTRQYKSPSYLCHKATLGGGGRQANDLLTLNVYSDIKRGKGIIESIPGFRKIKAFDKELFSLSVIKGKDSELLMIHSGDGLYLLARDENGEYENTPPIARLAEKKSCSFAFGNIGIITDGQRLLYITSEGEVLTLSEDGYITGCTAFALYDGRLFASGGGEFPERIFYSSAINSGKALFDNEQYLREVSGHAPTEQLFTLDGALWIFKSFDDGGGNIIRLHGTEGSYTVSQRLTGESPLCTPVYGQGCPLMLTKSGLWKIERSGDSYRLLQVIGDVFPKDRARSPSMTVWQGYTVISLGEYVYLLSEKGIFPLYPIGGYINDRRVYRYGRSADGDLRLHPIPDKKAEGRIFSYITAAGKTLFYSEEGEKKYAVYPTEEREGGELMPCIEMKSDRERLWFYTQRGLYCFNSDKIGVAPDTVKSAKDFNCTEYSLNYGDALHPLFYSFDNHSPLYSIRTSEEDLDSPCKEKHSRDESLFIKIEAVNGGEVTVRVISDGSECARHKIKLKAGLPGRAKILRLNEKAYSWLEKQIAIESSDFASPILLRSVSYLYNYKERSNYE